MAGVFEKSEFRDVLRCRGCYWVWKNPKTHIHTKCPRCGRSKDARNRREYMLNKFKDQSNRILQKWRNKNPQEYSTQSKRRHLGIRKSAILLVGKGKVECVRCGCDRIEFLDINHINGGGTKEIKLHATKFTCSIIQLKRQTDDLELLCRVCHALHHLEQKYGKLPYHIEYKNK